MVTTNSKAFSRVVRTMVLGAAIPVALVACSGGSGSVSSGASTASTSSAFVEELCATLAPCCAKVNQPTDGAKCKTIFNVLVESGMYSYDPNKGSACLAELRRRQGSATFCETGGNDSLSCNGVFTEGGASGGTKQPGEECTSTKDCAT